MDKLIKLMEDRAKVLRNGIKIAERDKKTFPEGHLRISRTNNQIRYYEAADGPTPDEKYISVKNMKLIRRLAQKTYNKTFLRNAKNELEDIEKLLKVFNKADADSCFTNLSSDRQNLIVPYIIPDHLYAKEWQSQNFQSNSYMPENIKYDTRRGEKVRSKSEAILADIMFELGIPYHYEKPLIISGGIVRYPDFTMLNVKTREEIYMEHFGLLDDEEYRRGCLDKLDEYRKNGIFPGKNLIFTYETSENPVDIKGIKEMLKELFDRNFL